jgi:hypothetical protein
MRKIFLAISILLGMTAAVAAAGYVPLVTMGVTLPDGQSQVVTAPESGLAQVVLESGEEIGFRPTIEDERPWTKGRSAGVRTSERPNCRAGFGV